MLTRVCASTTVGQFPAPQTRSPRRRTRPMITVPAHRVKQFGVEFFQASFSAKDIDRLVKFEVLGYGGADHQPPAKGKQRVNRARVNWEALQKRIGGREDAHHRAGAPA